MKYLLLLTSVLAFILVSAGPGIWAQEGDEFVLEDIVVTAEKREVNVQDIAASVQAMVGADLLERGKITTQQILEDVPNVTFRGGKAENPNGNVAIRGLQSTQDSGVGGQGPSVTATYVDDVFQGIGGNYDVNRVEVLRGPQGTLYGRSSPAGVIAFHTNDPILDEFSANVSAEMGTEDLVNMQFAVNAPIGDKIALRAAGHFFEGDDYFAGEGVSSKTKEGRVKLLFQPIEELSFLASVSYQKNTSYGGGYFPTLVGPNEFDYYSNYTDPATDLPQEYRQGSLEAHYDLGGSTLTYIGAIHDFESEGLGAPTVNKGSGGLMVGETVMPKNEYMTHEVRWASDSEGRLTWIIGANYFKHEFDFVNNSIQTSVPPGDTYEPAEDIIGAVIFFEGHKGTWKNYGLFTEETFELTDAFRITAGLRYDKTDIDETTTFTINDNLNEFGNSLKPEIYTVNSYTDTPEFDNITYKLRLAYDLTPNNMIYALTSTGFMPGQSGASPMFGPKPDGSFGVVGFQVLLLEEKKLTAYEVGTKNQFFDNRLRLNGAVFYYDYEGYQEAVNVTEGKPGPPFFTLVSVPLEMIGAEVSAQWLMTERDRMSMDLGALRSEIAHHTDIPGYGSTEQFMKLKKVPGHPDWQATLSYDHSFLFNNGSVLVPRVQFRYSSGHYVNQITQYAIDTLIPIGYDLYAYDYQDDYVVTDINFTWTSADGNFSFVGYLRNAFDEEYKTAIDVPSLQGPTLSPTFVNVGDPRVWGLMFRARF